MSTLLLHWSESIGSYTVISIQTPTSIHYPMRLLLNKHVLQCDWRFTFQQRHFICYCVFDIVSVLPKQSLCMW